MILTVRMDFIEAQSAQGLGLLYSTDPWESLELKPRPRGGLGLV